MQINAILNFWFITFIYEVVGLWIRRNTGPGAALRPGGLGGRSPLCPNQVITDCTYFKTLSYTTSDVYWITGLSCYIFRSQYTNFPGSRIFYAINLFVKTSKVWSYCEKTSQDASDARYEAVFFGLHCIWLCQSLSGAKTLHPRNIFVLWTCRFLDRLLNPK